MIDVHAHFAEEGYDLPAEWEKIQHAGVKRVVLAADTLEHAEEHARFAEAHEGAYFTVGIHPEFAGKPLEEARFLALARREKCVAVGEIGLDYHYGAENKREQIALFERQLALAKELSLPVQIHSRDACADTLEVLHGHRDALKGGFLMHCYSYGAENLAAFLSLGAYFSFGGVVCFKNARRAVEAAERCPMERLLTETDSPYLSPFRGEKNTPANIPVVLARLAEIKGISQEEMEKIVEKNAERLFFKLGAGRGV